MTCAHNEPTGSIDTAHISSSIQGASLPHEQLLATLLLVATRAPLALSPETSHHPADVDHPP
jgi:hypothetical protein